VKLFKIFLRVLCTVIIRCTETFWSLCSSRRWNTQYAISSEEHHEATNWQCRMCCGMHNTCTIDTIRWLFTSTESCCEHVPESVINTNGTAIMWHAPVITVWTVLPDRPDGVLHATDMSTDRYGYTRCSAACYRHVYWSIWLHQMVLTLTQNKLKS
jgi:hypothetical protein